MFDNNNPVLTIDTKQLKNPSFLIYVESLSLNNLESGIIKEICNNYLKMMKKSESELNNFVPNLSIFNFKNPELEKVGDFFVNPPIQPHDSKISSVFLNNETQSIVVQGKGNSYLDYNDYVFCLNFSGVDETIIEKYNYNNGSLLSTEVIQSSNIDTFIQNTNLREVVVSRDSRLKNEISFYYINMNFNDDNDTGERDVKLLKFCFDSVVLECVPENKKNKKLKA